MTDELDYNGDRPEDTEGNRMLTELFADPGEYLSTWEKGIASDYFKYGWEAHKRFIDEQGGHDGAR